MHLRPYKTLFFVLTGLNSFATTFFFNYLLFLFRNQFHFGRKETLALGAVHGLMYLFFSWRGGRLAQRLGYLPTLGLGLSIMLASLAAAGLFPAFAVQVGALMVWTAGMSLTWPALEALVCDGEDERGLPRMVGIYNLTWAGTAAAGYFTGGAIFDYLGLAGLYGVPLAVLVLQISAVAWLMRCTAAASPHAQQDKPADPPPPPPAHAPEAAALAQPVPPETFLKMAWLANPFAYMAINTIVLIIPDLARQFQLTPTQSGIFCSVWFFMRLLAFAVLWKWTAWHYRFRWLAGSYVALVAGFLTLLLAPQLWLVIVAQILFGLATGLIYYSSLFYAMDVGEASQGEHGGLHEAAIGLGICVGPALGAASLYAFPGSPHTGTYAVGLLLLTGLAGLLWLRWRPSPQAHSPGQP
jgi:predicted MFS family arabinose efflux permease